MRSTIREIFVLIPEMKEKKVEAAPVDGDEAPAKKAAPKAAAKKAPAKTAAKKAAPKTKSDKK